MFNIPATKQQETTYRRGKNSHQLQNHVLVGKPQENRHLDKQDYNIKVGLRQVMKIR
jgi:hypothetical protein